MEPLRPTVPVVAVEVLALAQSEMAIAAVKIIMLVALAAVVVLVDVVVKEASEDKAEAPPLRSSMFVPLPVQHFL